MTETVMVEESDNPHENDGDQSPIPLSLTTSHPIGNVSIIKRCVDNQAINPEHLCLLNMIMPSFGIPVTQVVRKMEDAAKHVCLAFMLTELLVAIRELHTAMSPAQFVRQLSSGSIGAGAAGGSYRDLVEIGRLDSLKDVSQRIESERESHVDENDGEIAAANGLPGGFSSDQPANPIPTTVKFSGDTKHFQRLRPLSIFFDDFQNCDIHSTRLLRNVLESPKLDHCLCVITHNDEKNLNAFCGKNFGKTDTTITRILPLSRPEISSILYSEFNLSSIEEIVLEKIYSTSEGFPGSAVRSERAVRTSTGATTRHLRVAHFAIGRCRVASRNDALFV